MVATICNSGLNVQAVAHAGRSSMLVAVVALEAVLAGLALGLYLLPHVTAICLCVAPDFSAYGRF